MSAIIEKLKQNIQQSKRLRVLSREEMKNVLGGLAPGGGVSCTISYIVPGVSAKIYQPTVTVATKADCIAKADALAETGNYSHVYYSTQTAS